jgi:WD40 repeat protein/serine/threonine protein kinase
MHREDLTGRRLGEFVLRQRIGEGGFGAVYRCDQPLLGRLAVVKVLHHRLRNNEVVLQRFMREAQLASRLDHPYAAHVYAFGVEPDDGLFWIAMEMVKGTPLDRWLRERGPLPLDQFVPFFERVAEVVQTAHEHGIVHRDLKPSNVMVIERAGRMLPKLLDFGIAKLHDDLPGQPRHGSEPGSVEVEVRRRRSTPVRGTTHVSAEAATLPGTAPPDATAAQLGPEGESTPSSSPALTRADAMMGSPPYMSPEQWRDSSAVGPRSDLYALGVLAYECMTGRRPFEAVSLVAYADLHCNATVPPLGDEFSERMNRCFSRALAKDPADRPATALELAAELRIAADLAVAPADLPRLDENVHDAWLADAPQPIAEAIAVLDAARNAHQARDAARELLRGLLRFLVAVALAARAQVQRSDDDPGARDLLRELRRRDLDDAERVELLRRLVRPFANCRDAYPLAELVDLVVVEHRDDPLDRVHVAMPTGSADEDVVRSQLVQLLGALADLMRATAFVLDYPLVVSRDGEAERWTGLRRPRRPVITTTAALDAGQPVLVRDGRPAVVLWPLAQAIAPTVGAAPELFVFDGRDRHGARLVASPMGYEHHAADLWDWFGDHVIGDEERGHSRREDERPPYLGLVAFSVDDADRFVGREREIDVFVNRLRDHALQVVVGPSGAGKSSFVHAGVVPALPAGWRTVSLRPGAAPLATLASRLCAAGVEVPDLRAVPTAVATAVAATVRGGKLVVIVDQLEELFTLGAPTEERLQFAAVLAALGQSDEAPSRVIATVRDDFLMHVEALGPLRGRLSPSLFLVGNPSRVDLVRTIIEPARRAGYELSDLELAHDMVAEVADQRGALALLSFTSSRLWELRDRRFRQLTRKAYAAMGGVGGALGQHAESTLAALPADEQRIVRDAFRHLVTAEGTRAVVARDELCERLASSRAEAVIDKLIRARLLAAADVDGTPQVEITHEALIAAWPRLQQWIREDPEGARMRDELRTAAAQWDKRGRQRGLLWRDEALVDLERWRRRDDVALSSLELAFADASWRAAVRGRRIRRGLVVAAFVVLGSTAIVMFRLREVAADQSEIAIRNARDAARQSDLARARARQINDQLASSYEQRAQQTLLAGDSDSARLFISEAMKLGNTSTAARLLAANALEPLRAQIATLRGHAGQLWSITFSPDGTRIITGAQDGTARIWDARDGRQLVLLDGHAPGQVRAAWAPRGDLVVTGDEAGQVRWWRPDGTLVTTASVSSGKISSIAFSADGRLAATAGWRDVWIGVWDATTGERIAGWPADAGVHDVQFDREGRKLLTGDMAGRVSLWSLEGRRLRSFSGHTGIVWFARFSPSGDRIATASLDGTARVWDLQGRSTVLREHEGRVTYVAWSRSGRWLATAGADRTARIWASTGELRAVLRGHTAQVNWVQFASDDDVVATAAGDGSARVWDASTGQPTAVFSHPGFLIAAAIDATGARLGTASWSGSAKLWALDQSARLARVEDPPNDVRVARALLVASKRALVWHRLEDGPHALAVSAEHSNADRDGRIAVLADGSTAIHILEPDREAHRVIRASGAIVAIAIAPSGDAFATWGENHALSLWTRDGRLLHERRVEHASTRNLAPNLKLVFSERGDRLLAFDIGREGATLLNGKDLAELSLLPGQHNAAVFARHGKLLTGGSDGVPRVWDDHGRPITHFPKGESQIGSVAWTPSQQQFLVGRFDGTLETWDVNSGRMNAAVKAHDAFISSIAIEPDGAQIATGSVDRVVRLWDAASLTQVNTVQTHDELIRDLQFDDSERLVVVGTNQITVWHIPAAYPGDSDELARLVACETSLEIIDGRPRSRDVSKTCADARGAR